MSVLSMKDPRYLEREERREEQGLVRAVREAVDSIEANLERSLTSIDRLEAKLEAFLK